MQPAGAVRERLGPYGGLGLAVDRDEDTRTGLVRAATKLFDQTVDELRAYPGGIDREFLAYDDGYRNWSYTYREVAEVLDVPLGTCVAGGVKHALVAAFLAKHFGGNGTPGWPLEKPLSTVTARDHQGVVASSLVKLRGDNVGSPADEPLHTVSAQGFHHAEVRAFLIAYYGNEADGIDPADPIRTVVSRERFGLVQVDGADYAIADIGLRMLTPRELFRAQGFPETYIIDQGVDGRRLPKDAQVRMCGNSVCPPLARALVEANVGEIKRAEEALVA